MSYSRRVFLNTFAQTFSRVISILIGIVSVTLLTRYLGPAGYGQFSTALVFVSFLSVLGDLGVQSILVRELSQNPEHKEKILGNVFIWRLFSAFLMFLVIVGVSRFMPYDGIVKLVIIIESARSAISLFRAYFTAVPQWKMRLDLAAWGEIIGRVSYLVILLLVVHFKLGLVALFGFMFIAYLSDLIFMYFSFKRIGGVVKLRLDPQFLKAFLKESIILGLASILGTIHYQIDTLILSVIKPAHDVGIYGAAYAVFGSLVVLPGIFLAAIFPRYSELAKSGKSWTEFFDFSLFLMWVAVLPLAFFTFLFAPYVIKVIGGSLFTQSVLPLQILAFALIGGFVAAPFASMAIALRKQKQVVFATAVAVLVNVGLNLILIPRYTYVGAAIATLVSENVVFLTFLFLFYKLMRFKINFWLWLKALLPLFLLVPFWFLIKYFLPLNAFSGQGLVMKFLEIGFVFVTSMALYLAMVLGFGLVPKKLFKEIIKPNVKA
jgi:O-antigen/teichoic acid export membrane protein